MKKIIVANQENFLFGGLIYHNKKIIDEFKRNEIFEKIKTNDYSEKEYDIRNLKMEIMNLKGQNSLSETALNNVIAEFSDTVKNPILELYTPEKHQNAFIDYGIKILPDDEIIFINIKGLVGDIYKQIEEQELAIIYEYDNDTGLYLGDVYDYKLIKDFKEYEKVKGDII